MRTIADADHGRENNFNLIRMVAATSVLFSHAVTIAAGRAAPEPLLAETGYSLGIAAVAVFFTVSGYFITKSFDRRDHIADFGLARASRIFPGLIVALCLTAFVLGPALTTLPLGEYFAARPTWIYAPKNALLVHQQFELPGLFDSNPFRGVANGSLWTLKYEVACYAGVIVAGYTGLLRRSFFPIVLVLAVAATILFPGPGMDMPARVSILCAAFAFGAGLYVYRARVPVSGVLAIMLAILAVMTRNTPLFPVCYALALGYAALAFGFARIPGLLPYNKLGDYSYGMYIYAFPIGQALRVLAPEIGPWELSALNVPLALVMAVLSWHFVESPVLAHRHRIAARLRLRKREV